MRELVESDGVVRGVRYRATAGCHDVQALLTVGSDGRFSRLRQLSRLPAGIKTSPPSRLQIAPVVEVRDQVLRHVVRA